ncbi:hypothetical protein [Exiguobacterium sp. R-39]|uniref:hypothetical protein n=1 Tax=Exiguobacterium sp. R-39 TaxID=3416708 RepID=UPI003CF02895
MNIYQPSSRFALRLPIQFFSGDTGGAGGDADPQGSGQGYTNPGDNKGASGTDDLFTPEQQQAINALIESAKDSVTNSWSHRTKNLEKTIEQLQNQGKTKEQLKEDAEKKFLAAQSELISDKAKFYASQKLNEQKLDARLLDFVVTTEGEDEETRQADMDGKIKTLTEVINALVAEQVQSKFQEAGYNPGNGNTGGNASGPTSLRDTIRKNQIKK